ncbi:DUF5983 family protein [Endobacter medicaginis]
MSVNSSISAPRTFVLPPARSSSSGQNLVSMSGRFGWLMHVPEDADGCEDLAACAELRPVYALARSKGCDFVLFDADAVADDRLELFDDDP